MVAHTISTLEGQVDQNCVQSDESPQARPLDGRVPLRRMAVQPAVACISSGSLLAGGTEVLIDHHGAVYRLKQTALGKLILTK